MQTRTSIEVSRIRELVTYDPELGIFRWRVKRVGSRIGDIVGSTHRNGYRRLMLDGKSILEHRAAWAYVHGAWPADQIDHINRQHDDNRIANLREASQYQNKQNSVEAQRNNKSSGLLGVSLDRRRGLWRAQIMVSHKRKYLGRFSTPQDAAEAYIAAKRDLHPFANISAGAHP